MGADGWITLFNADAFDRKYPTLVENLIHFYERRIDEYRIYTVYEDTERCDTPDMNLDEEDAKLWKEAQNDDDVLMDVWEVWT